ncbi:hypothetical protein C5023_000220 [Staphylococcus phage vB_SauM_0414_108]|nr:hypothetical protein C5023_000220 [Staphylococcus phage vB_SauM_0414_108]
MNITELLSIIVEGMSKEGVELNHVEIYEEAVDINNQVKVCIGNNCYLVHRVNEGGGVRCWSEECMVDKVLELLKPTINKGDYITDGEQSGKLIRVEDGKYHIIDLKINETLYYDTFSLEELENMGWKRV